MTQTDDVVGQLTRQIEDVDAELAAAREEIVRLQGVVRAAESTREQLRAENAALDAESRKLQVAFEEALNGAAEVDGAPSLVAENSALRAELADSRGVCADLEGQVEHLTGRLRRCELETADAVAIAASEKEQRETAEQERNEAAAALADATAELAEIPARAVRALHEAAEQVDKFDTAPEQAVLLRAADLVADALAG